MDASAFSPDGNAAEVYEYLADEVMARQSEDVADFLKKSAVLETITATDCDLLLERDDSRQMLELLERQNLFLIPLAGAGRSYRYHQLFREFLLDRLGAERHRWQRQAGIIARDHGDLSTAVEYFRAAGTSQELLGIMKEAARQAFSQGRWQTVVRWLEAVAIKDLSDDPWLSLYRAKNEIYQGRLDEAEKWLNGTLLLFMDNGDEAGLAESRLLQARILRCRGRFENCIELLEQVTQQLPAEESARYFDLPLEKSTCLFFAGRFAEAEVVLTGALDAAKRNNDKYAMAHLMEGLGHAYFGLGDYPKALQMYKRRFERLPEWFLPSYHMQDYIAFIYLDWGEWEQALNYAKRNEAIKGNLRLTDALPSTYIQLANIYLSRGDWQLAEEYCNRAVNCVRENGGGIYSAISLSVKAECLSVQGRWIEAQESAEQALAEARLYNGAVEGLCQLLSGLSFIYAGDLQRGKELIAGAMRKFEQPGFKRGQYYGYAFLAWLYVNEGNPAEARRYTQKVLKLSAENNLLNVFLTHYELLQSVLELGMENGIEVRFVQRILARMGERAMHLLTQLAKHNNPKVRLQVIAPLAEIRGSHADAIITYLSDDVNAEVRQSARLAAQRVGIQAAPVEICTKLTTVSLQVNMLGSFKVFTQGTELGTTGWRTAKTHDLLAYLIHRGEPVSRDRIQEDLWPDLAVENAANIFHVTLHRLRKMLAQASCSDIVFYVDKHYGLQMDSFRCDTQRFQELAAAGFRKEPSPEERLAYLEQAAALYRGDYLEDLDYLWLLHYREKLKRLYAEIRMSLARHYLEIHSYAQAIAHLHIVEEEDPFAEEAHALLMKAYVGQGSRTAAIRQYQKVETILKTELGLRPSMQLHNLYLKLVK